jgi:hypothetical protein
MARAGYDQPVNRARVSLQRTLVGAGIAVAASLTLTGCLGGATTAAQTSSPTPAPTVTVTATPPPAPPVTVTATPAPPVAPVETAPPEEVAPTVPFDPEQADPNAVVITPPTDNGPAPGAAGSVQVDSAGTPYRYTVAAGDIAVEIATRFHRYIWQLADKNAVMLTDPALIHEGDTILLTATEMPAGYVIPSR